jgi:PAS domain-containing protein
LQKRSKIETRLRSPRPGLQHDDHLRCSPETAQIVKTLLQARTQTLKRTVFQWEIVEDIASVGIPMMDPQTGMLRPAQSLPRAAILSDVVDLFQDDAELFPDVDKSGLSVWIARPDTENIHVSPFLSALTGVAAEAFRANGWLEVIHPSSRQYVIAACTEGFKTLRAFTLEYWLRSANGAPIWVADYIERRYQHDGSFGGYAGTIYRKPHDVRRRESILG